MNRHRSNPGTPRVNFDRPARSLAMTIGGLLGAVGLSACMDEDALDELAVDSESSDAQDDEPGEFNDDATTPMLPGSPDTMANPATGEAQTVSLSVTDPHVRVVGGTGSCTVDTSCVDSVPMTGTVSSLFDSVDHSMRQYMQINCVGGGVLAVSRNGRRVYKRGFGRTKGAASAFGRCPNNDWDGLASPVRPDTPFPVASVTKFLTAATVRELLLDDGKTDPSAEKAVDHLPTYLQNYFVHTSVTGTCAPVPGFVQNGTNTPGSPNEDADPLGCASFAHPDDRWSDITIGDLIGHSSGFGWPGFPGEWYDQDFAAMRSNTIASDWEDEDASLLALTDYPTELEDAREDIRDTLNFNGATLPNTDPIALENIIFLNYYNEEGNWTPVDEYLIRSAGNKLEDPGPAQATDASPAGSTTRYSNNAYRMLGRIAAHLHAQLHAGEDLWAAPEGAPQLHDDTALGWFLALNEIDEGVWSDEAIFSRQFGYAPGYVDPTPVSREWDVSTNEYERLERSWMRPWCVLYGSSCDFEYWRDGEVLGNPVLGLAPSWDFATGPFSSLQPFHRRQPNSLMGSGDLAAEMPALLILTDRYYAEGGSGSGTTRMGMRLDDWESLFGTGTSSLKTGDYEGVVARVLQLRGDTVPLDVAAFGAPVADSNDELTFDLLWTGPNINFTTPDEVDAAVAVNQGSHEAWNDDTYFKFLHRFVMYGLRDINSAPGGGVDWDAVDRMIHHQGRHVVGMSMNWAGNTVYWYEGDGAISDVSEVGRAFTGTPASHQGGTPTSTFDYALPATRIGTDVLGVAIKDEISDATYAWYDDGHYSVGYNTNLEATTTSAVYTLPNAYGSATPLMYDQLIDVAFSTAGASFSWYTDGTRASGTAGDLDFYWTDDFVVHSQQLVGEVEAVALDWAGTNHVWARYRDGSVSEGNSGSLATYGYWPARPIAISVAGYTTTFFYATGWYREFSGMPPGASGATQVSSGYWHSGNGSVPADYRDPSEMVGYARKDLASSVSRIYYSDGDGALVTAMVPGSENAMVYPAGQTPGHVIDVATGSTGIHYTYFDTGVRAKGTSTDLGWHNNLVGYTLAPGKTYSNLIAVGMTDSGEIWAAYDDGSYSSGTTTDLDAYGVF